MGPEQEAVERERRRLLALLRRGPDPDEVDAADRDFADAFLEGVGRRIERWAWRALFDSTPPAYLVAEAVTTEEDAAGGARVVRAWPAGEWLGNWLDWSWDGTTAAPVVRRTWLAPTRSNVVSARADEGRVWLTVECAGDPRPAGEGAADAELDLYCDPGNPPRAEALDAFRDLLWGAWPDEVAQDGEWPRDGLREIGAAQPRAEPGPADLIEGFSHPFAERFARLPLRPLCDHGLREGRLRVPVDLPNAAAVAAALNGGLFVNHVLFWNRVPRTLRPDSLPVRLPAQPGGSPPLILEATDLETGRPYRERRWAYAAEPAAAFDLIPADGDPSMFEIRWCGTPSAADRLRVTFLTAHRWDPSASGPWLVRHDGGRRMAVRTPATKVGAPGPDARCVLLSWLAAGLGAIPGGAPAVSRDEVEALFWRLTPPMVRRLAEKGRERAGAARLDFATVLRPIPGGRHAAPVTLVALPCPAAEREAAEALAHQLRRLARRAERRCWAGARFDVSWRFL